MGAVSSWALVVGYAALIFLLSSQSQPSLPSTLFSSDKLAHVVEYSVLGVLLANALRRSRPAWSRTMVLGVATLIGAGYGVSDEVHQSFVPLRESSGLDALADLVGSAVGGVTANALPGWRERRIRGRRRA